jgi:hypothetical protein
MELFRGWLALHCMALKKSFRGWLRLYCTTLMEAGLLWLAGIALFANVQLKRA